MTTKTNRIEEIFRDAREIQGVGLEMLDQGTIRNAAEKAWGTTKRATDALVLGKHGEDPQSSGQAQEGVPATERPGPELRTVPVLLSHQVGSPARQLLLRRQLRTGAGDGGPDTGYHHIHPDRREPFH